LLLYFFINTTLWPVDKFYLLHTTTILKVSAILLAQLLCEIENDFLIKISACEILKNLTVADLAQYIMRAMNSEKSNFENSCLVQSGGST